VSACTELLRDSNRLIEARTRQDERELLATGAKPSQAIDERGDCQGSGDDDGAGNREEDECMASPPIQELIHIRCRC
jgi:hypothetical protein